MLAPLGARSALATLATLAALVALVALACDSQPQAPPGGFSDTAATPSDPDGTSVTPDGVGPDGVGPDAVTDTAEPEPVVPGALVWRRLNRTEYRNTVRDLLGTTLDPGKDLPSDDLGYGFDNVASVLTMSPLHLELYERGARILAEEITTTPVTEEVRLVTEAETLPISVDYGGVAGDAFILWSPGDLTIDVDVPRTAAWRFEMRAWEDAAGDERAKVAVWVDGQVKWTFDLVVAPDTYGFEVALDAGRHTVAVEFLNDFYEAPADRNAYIDWFGIAGPVALDRYEDTAWARHVKCRPDVMQAGGAAARACARDTVATLAERAWRRPLASADVDALMALYDGALADSADGAAPVDPVEALALPLQAVLLSPRFLFKVELPHDAGGGGDALDAYEVATRLSYFLWSTLPDAPLLAAAADGSLLTDAGIVTQVRRMLADPRAEALVDNFAGQWLYIRDVDNAIPDPWAFPEFDDALRHAMGEEMRRFFRSFVFEDRSLVDLLTRTDTYVNRRLAEHYGLADADIPPDDDTWRLASVAAVGRRGLVTQAGLLTALSTPFRTSIVRRGKWVLSQLLCAEPAAPPPGVEGLVDMTQPGEAPRTLRDKMELHKTEERCRNCHQTMDAIGYGLEGFDGIGMRRTTDNGFPIDARGEIRGHAFDGAAELADALVADGRMPACVVDKVMIYALGRGLDGADEPLLDRVLADFAARGHRFAALVELIATSEAFRRREVTP